MTTEEKLILKSMLPLKVSKTLLSVSRKSTVGVSNHTLKVGVKATC